MRRVLVVVGLLVAACSKGGTAKPTSWPGIQDMKGLLAGVPGDAALVLVGEAPRPFAEMGAFLDEASARAMQAEIAAFVAERTGVTLANARSAALFVRGRDVGLIVHGASGELKGANAEGLLEISGATVARRADLLVLGERGAVTAALAVLDKKAPDLAAQRPELVATLLAEARGAIVAAAVDSASMTEEPFNALGKMGVTGGMVSISANGLRAVLSGPDDKLQEVAKLITAGLAELDRNGQQMKRTATAGGDLLEGVSAIAVAHHTAWLQRAAAPKVAGGHLTVELSVDLGQAAMIVPAIGILAAVAIPAFMKNARKAKTAEAVTLVKKMYDSARSVAEEKGAFPEGKVGPTPPLGACCAQGGKCRPDPGQWQAPLWKALDFSIEDPHYFSYTYSGERDAFTATANGDLDCDGVYSTFEIIGRRLPDGSVTGGAGLFRDQELE